jgi:sensor histidine kinase YesM
LLVESFTRTCFFTTTVEKGGTALFRIDEKQRLILTEKVNFRETSIHISAVNADPPVSETDSLAAIFPSPSTITIQRENFLVIKVIISDSFCPGSRSSTTTIVIVSLSVLCIVFLASFSMAMIALRRSRPALFNSKHKMNGNGNQVGPGPGSG